MLIACSICGKVKEKYRDYLMKKAHQTEREFDLTLSTLMGRIDFIPEEEFLDSMEEAEKIMKEIDPKDSPFLAVGIAVNATGIWSEDKDFDGQAIMKRYSTSDLYSIILP